MTLPTPKALLFDWDNTLVDSWVVIHHALSVTFKAMGLKPWTLAETRQRVRKSARDTFPELFGDRAQEATDLFYRTYEADHLEQLSPFHGAEAMLSELAALEGLQLGVVSNKMGPLLRREAVHLGWDRYFVSLVGATDAVKDKPAPEVVDFALSGTGVDPGPAVWFIGDTDIDLLCAQNSGCSRILLRDTPPGPDEFGPVAVDRHVRDCLDLYRLVQQYRP